MATVDRLVVRTVTIVDAGLISSCRRPRKMLDVMPEDRKEGIETSLEYTITYSDDSEAAWVRKGNRPHYGYKMHMATDLKGFVLGGHITPANVSDTSELSTVLKDVKLHPHATILTDKGYASAKNRDSLKDYG